MALKRPDRQNTPPAADQDKEAPGAKAGATGGDVIAAQKAGRQAVNDAAEANQAEAVAAEEKASAKTLKDSGVKALKDSEVKPGKYRTNRIKMSDPETNLMFYPNKATTVHAVTGWVEGQVKAGVLVRCEEAPATEK